MTITVPSVTPKLWFPIGAGYSVPAWRWRIFSPLVKLELDYISLLSEILNKPDWWVKKDVPEIRAKWETEIKELNGQC
jgi:hypothetical protein